MNKLNKRNKLNSVPGQGTM